jgi:hypothetical protein
MLGTDDTTVLAGPSRGSPQTVLSKGRARQSREYVPPDRPKPYDPDGRAVLLRVIISASA